MANIASPYGFRPVQDATGRPWSGAARLYSTPTGDGTALYIGDPVLLLGTGQTIAGRPYTDVTKAATTDVLEGVVVGVVPITRDSLLYRAASTQRLVWVCNDPNAMFQIQEVSSGTALTVNDIGLNVSFTTATGGSTTTGLSGVMVDNTTEATTNTLALKLMGIVARADNTYGAVSQDWLVRINRHRLTDQIAGV